VLYFVVEKLGFEKVHAMQHHIVVFNHSSNVLLLIESVLEQKGFQVSTFLETLTDVTRVIELSPDLVIIGHVRGIVDEELDIIHQFRTTPETAHVPIIVCTTGAALVQRGGSLEGVSYVTIVPKPFDVHELVDAVYIALGLRSPEPSASESSGSVTDAPVIL
jgi:DNA-binding response OmpR family regulator